MVKYTSATPYIASYCILRRDSNIAFVLRSNTGWMDGYYSLPAGKTEWNEEYRTGAIREAREEVGVDIEIDDLAFKHVMHRHSEDSDWVDVYFEATKWRGEPTNVETQVHAELAWLDPKNLPENVVPAVKSAIESIEKNQQYSGFGWE